MALEVATGVLATGTGAIGTTVTVSGLAFQPKALIFFSNGRTSATSAAGRASSYTSIGFATGASNQVGLVSTSIDAGADSAGAAYQDVASCVVIANGTAADGILRLQSINSDGFTLEVIDVFPRDTRFIYVAYGGSDITDATVSSVQGPVAPGTVDVTSLTFQPDILLFAGQEFGAATTQTNATASILFFGAASGTASANQGVIAWGQDDASATMDTGAYGRGGEVSARLGVSSPIAVPDRASVSALSSTGFTLNFAAAQNGDRIWFLAMKGGDWHVTTSATRTDTTPWSLSGFGHQPAGLLVASVNRAEDAAGTGTRPSQMSMGAATGASSRASVFARDNNATATAEVSTGIQYDALYGNLDSTGAVVGLMDLSSIDSDGVTLVMDDADPTANWFFLVSAGSAAGGTDYPRGVSSSVAHTAAAARLAALARADAESTAHTASAARAQVLARAGAETVANAGALARAGALPRDATSSVAHSADAARALGASRPASSSVEHTGDATRAQALTRPLAATADHAAALARQAAHTRQATTSASHTASLARLTALGRLLAASVEHTAVAAAAQGVVRALAATASHIATVERAINGGASALTRAVSSSISHAASLARALVVGRAAAASSTHDAAASRSQTLTRPVSADAGHTGLLSRAVGGVQALAASVAHSAALGHAQALTRALGVAVAPVATLARAQLLARAPTWARAVAAAVTQVGGTAASGLLRLVLGAIRRPSLRTGAPVAPTVDIAEPVAPSLAVGTPTAPQITPGAARAPRIDLEE